MNVLISMPKSLIKDVEFENFYGRVGNPRLLRTYYIHIKT